MSDFAGIVRTDNGPIPDAALQRITRALEGAGKPQSWRPNPSVLLVERRGQPGYDNGSGSAVIQRDADRFILATARLDDPRGVKTALGLDGPSLPDDRSLAAAAALRWGAGEAAEKLYGEFAIAEWDERAQRLTIARDALGSRPVYTVTLPGMVIFATTLQILMALPETPRELDEVVVAHTLTIAMQDQEQTIYRHIRRVPPGGVAIFENGQWRSRRWFTIDRLKPVRFKRDEDYVEAARELFDQAVRSRLSPDGRNGAFLSGGFDSAGVAATAAILLGDRKLEAFTRAAGADHADYGFDERGLAGLVAERYPNIKWTVIDDVRESIRDVEPEAEMGALLVPRSGSFNGTWFESLHMAVQDAGIDVMLGGGTGNSVLSWDGSPQFAQRLRRFQWLGALRDLKGFARQKNLSATRTALGTAWDTLMPRRIKAGLYQRRHGGGGRWPWMPFSLVSPGFLDEIDYGRHADEAGHDIPFKPPFSVREMRLRMLQGQRGRDMAAFARRRWRASTRDPYLDRALVEFALAIPEDQYWREGKSRWLARRVLAGRVPDEILSQRIKGRQSPEWHFLASRRLDETAAAVDRLSRSKFASRVIDIPRIRQIIEEWPTDEDAARKNEMLHGHALHRAISMGGFLRWHEGGNE
ncbi:asparagine synthase-related protein [Sphingomonas sp. AOB5]|uniref:asparagine synthetase B family protein n=1 Tax=Sphingomonas sp. AOB5 TaxID=3034017 RepID=UPI0023F6E1E2|nr:asparagine synthase-related protein [Sphingomonas sp. AOB5]MDF7776831.1 asparagine synthase-related protein [Sphingomonas sp. AOB5]